LQKIKFYLIPLILGIIIYSCEKEDSTVVDPLLTFPIITSTVVTPNTFDTTILNSVFVAVIESQEIVASVNARVTNPHGTILGDVALKDDGVMPDSMAGDGRFTGLFSHTLTCKLIGNYNVEFSAQNSSGTTSNIVVDNFSVTSSFNNPPSVNYVISPDSLRRPSGVGADTVNVGFLQVWPTDPDGVCDVSQVYFYSFRPDGSATNNGNPIFMFDNGNQANCDSAANDGKFSLCIQIVNNPNAPGYTGPPQTGNYRFRYFAKDISGLESDSLVKIINVYP
jgi:hypothetical protein